MEQGKASFEMAGRELDSVKADLTQHMTDADARFASLEKCTKSTLLWMIIIVVLLLVLMLILVLSNRKNLGAGMKKMEAKADNMRQALELEVKELKKTHDSDLEEIRKGMEDLKKK